MNLEQVKNRLELARKRLRKVSKEVRELRQIILEAGENPDLPKHDLTDRNKQFFIKWKTGSKFTAIAKEYSCSTTTVSKVCHRIEFILANKKSDYSKYADLNKYRLQSNKRYIVRFDK